MTDTSAQRRPRAPQETSARPRTGTTRGHRRRCPARCPAARRATSAAGTRAPPPSLPRRRGRRGGTTRHHPRESPPVRSAGASHDAVAADADDGAGRGGARRRALSTDTESSQTACGEVTSRMGCPARRRSARGSRPGARPAMPVSPSPPAAPRRRRRTQPRGPALEIGRSTPLPRPFLFPSESHIFSTRALGTGALGVVVVVLVASEDRCLQSIPDTTQQDEEDPDRRGSLRVPSFSAHDEPEDAADHCMKSRLADVLGVSGPATRPTAGFPSGAADLRGHEEDP